MSAQAAPTVDAESYPGTAMCAGKCGTRLRVDATRSKLQTAFSETVANGKRVFYCRTCTKELYRREA